MKDGFLEHVEAVVGDGKAVISADDNEIIALVENVINSGKSASFYVSSKQASEIRAWYWTYRLQRSKIKVISNEEKERIETELGLKNIGTFRFSPIKCDNCGHVYGAFEFLQQGIREHGLDAVKAVFALRNSTFLRVNPSFHLICPNCQKAIIKPDLEYDCDKYGGCCFGNEE